MMAATMILLLSGKHMGAKVKIMVRDSSDKTKVKIWKLKACPRCGGDVFLDKVADAWDVQCLQCGYKRELGNTDELELPTEHVKKSIFIKKRRPLKK